MLRKFMLTPTPTLTFALGLELGLSPLEELVYLLFLHAFILFF